MPISASALHFSDNRDRDKSNADSCFYPPAVTPFTRVCIGIVFRNLALTHSSLYILIYILTACRGKHMSLDRLKFNSELGINRTETLRHAIKVRNVSRGCPGLTFLPAKINKDQPVV